MTVGAEPGAGSAFWRTVKKIDKSKLNNRWMALRNAIAVALPLGVGLAWGHPLIAVAVTTGALNVSFSDGRDPYLRRARRMLTWSFLGAVAVFIGSITGNNSLAAIAVVAGWAFLAGMLIAVGTHAGDLGLNTLVTLIVFAGRGATDFHGALDNGLLVLGGGLLQSVFCLAFWPVRRYEPERRAVGHVFLNLGKEVDPDSDVVVGTTPLNARSADEQDTIDALGRDHSVEGERFRLLFDQADRLRLSIYIIGRLRDRLGERDDQKSEAEEEAADLLDALMRCVSKLLREVGDGLIKKVPPSFRALEDDLQHLVDRAHQWDGKADWTLGTSIAAAVDVLAGQLRVVVQLVENTDRATISAADNRPETQNLKDQFSDWAATLRANLDLKSAICRHAIRLSLCVAAGDWLERSVGWQRAYWLPMTVAVVLKPDFTSTFSRGLLRLTGTFVGLILATAILHFLPVPTAAQVLFVAAFSFCLRYWGPANYGLFTLAVSGLIVFLLDATGNQPGPAMAARASNTIAGGLLALAAYAVWPTWERTQVSDGFAEMIDASRAYLQRIFQQSATNPSGRSDFAQERLEWQRTRSNVEASVDRAITEPGIRSATRDTLLSMLASSHSLMLAIVGLGAGVSPTQTPERAKALQTFAHDVDFTLYFLSAALRGSKPASQALPQLREDYRKLIETSKTSGPDDAYVLVEADRLTVSLNTLREQVMRLVS